MKINKENIDKILNNFTINSENIDNLTNKCTILSQKYIKIIQNKLNEAGLEIENKDVFKKIENDIFDLLNIESSNKVLQKVKDTKILPKHIKFNKKHYKCDMFHKTTLLSIPKELFIENGGEYFIFEGYKKWMQYIGEEYIDEDLYRNDI